ncbi:hypothetical protein [Microbacterium gubbeenense]|uniref:hypothetical protein n=1 Tax=Microbacterium gubbeenense TaxID=159896 RepID=UPI003F9E192D
MAKKSAILAVNIVGDARDATKAFKEAEKRARAMQNTFETAAKGATVALAGLGAAAWHVAGVASEAQQAAGAVESVFGASSKAIQGYADDASKAVGLSSQSYNELAAVLGSQMKNMGLSGKSLTDETNNLIGLGADLAATFGGTTADAVSAVSSLLRGERDPIERYGVSIKQADVNARLAAMGLTGLEGEAAKAAERQATLALLTDQTSSALGQFERESDTAAGAQQRATAEWENAQAKLGEALLPTLVDLAGILEKVATWVAGNEETVRNLAIALGIFSGALVVARGAQIAMNIAMAANPVGLIITAIGALVAAIALIASNWEAVKKAVEPVITWLSEAIENVVGWIQAAIDGIGSFIDGFKSGFGNVVGNLFGANSATATVAYMPDTSRLLGTDSLMRADTSRTSLARTTARIGATSAPAPVRAGDTINNITVNGAIDADSTARQIEKVVASRGRRAGRGIRGGTTWRR